jgi:hypothetical protein
MVLPHTEISFLHTDLHAIMWGKGKQEKVPFITEFTHNNMKFKCPLHLSDEISLYTRTDV